MIRRIVVMSSALLVSLVASMSAQAVPAVLNLSKTPLFVNVAVDPNLLITFDDSGSMANGYVPDDVVGQTCYFRYRSYYANQYNGVYYNPNVNYAPPLDANGVSFANESYSAAHINGYKVAKGTVNLGTAYYVTKTYTDSSASNITYSSTGTSKTSCSSQNFKFPVVDSAAGFYCTQVANPTYFDDPRDTNPKTKRKVDYTNDANYTCQAVSGSEQTNFANWFAFYRNRSNALKTALSRAMGVIDDDIRVAYQNMNSNAVTAATTIDRFSGTARTTFFTSLYNAPISGNTPTLTSTVRAGQFFQRATGNVTTNPYWDSTLGKELSCRQNYHVLVTDGYWNQPSGVWPSLPAAKNAYNTGKTLPDGKVFSITDKNSRIVWAQDNYSNNCPSGDSICNPSYTDIAFYYWSTDLRSDLTNNVTPFLPDRSTGVTDTAVDLSTVSDLLTVPEIYWNPANDPATWQHVDQFFIGFGIAGDLPFTTAEYTALRDGKANTTVSPPITAGQTWSGPRNNDSPGVDDSWHAALVSRGQAFGTTDPGAIVDALTDVLSAIVARKGSAAAVSVATGIVTGATLTYQTVYDSTDASGTVLARRLNLDFSFAPKPTWDASCILTGGTCLTTGTTEVARPDWNTGRQILTSRGSGAGQGTAFRWGNLSSTQQSLVGRNPQTSANDTLGSDRVDYVRGARNKEKQFGGPFRNRNFLMGSIVDSSAEYIGAPREVYELSTALTEANSYRAFKSSNANRAGVVYVGANDGMLHALNADTGVELWAYVPYAVYGRLNQLTNPLYTFENYVDNTPTVRDVFINGAWKTVLVGTLRRGGQGLFAIDVTTTPTEGSAAASVLWDMTDTNDADLGFTYGRPFITRLKNDRWVALVPAGYNSQEADSFTGSGASVLFVIDLANGSVLRKFNVTTEGGDAASTGLAAPIGVDIDSNEITDLAYAGDLNGNIWRFNFNSTTPASWTVSRLYKPTVAFDRPITAQPRALRHPTLGVPIVLVGTGKFIEVNDRSPSIPVQAFYGIRDTGTLVNQTDLTTANVVATTGGIRKLGTFTPPSAGAAAAKGWQIQFTDTVNAAGERVIAPASLRLDNNEVIFATLIPGGTDPCIPGGRSFLMFADAVTGGAANDGYAFFDTNGDKKIDATDDATAQGKLVTTLVPGVASVIQQGGGIGSVILPPDPGSAASAGGGIQFRVSEWRRHSWREKFIHQ